MRRSRAFLLPAVAAGALATGLAAGSASALQVPNPGLVSGVLNQALAAASNGISVQTPPGTSLPSINAGLPLLGGTQTSSPAPTPTPTASLGTAAGTTESQVGRQLAPLSGALGVLAQTAAPLQGLLQ